MQDCVREKQEILWNDSTKDKVAEAAGKWVMQERDKSAKDTNNLRCPARPWQSQQQLLGG